MRRLGLVEPPGGTRPSARIAGIAGSAPSRFSGAPHRKLCAGKAEVESCKQVAWWGGATSDYLRG